RAADESERPWVQRGDGVARGVVGVEGHRPAEEVPERAPHRAEHEPPERLGLGRRDHREAVGGDAARGERPVVAPEERNAPDAALSLAPGLPGTASWWAIRSSTRGPAPTSTAKFSPRPSNVSKR